MEPKYKNRDTNGDGNGGMNEEMIKASVNRPHPVQNFVFNNKGNVHDFNNTTFTTHNIVEEKEPKNETKSKRSWVI